MTFTLTRSGGTAAFDVNFATANGTATAGEDYVAASGIVRFAAGETQKTVSVTINGDTKFEAQRDLQRQSLERHQWRRDRGRRPPSARSRTTTSSRSRVRSSSAMQAIAEGNAGTKVMTFTLTRSGGTAAFDVNFATANGTATVADGDYVASSGIVRFAAGETQKTVSVTINGDTKFEAQRDLQRQSLGRHQWRHDRGRQPASAPSSNDDVNRAPTVQPAQRHAGGWRFGRGVLDLLRRRTSTAIPPSPNMPSGMPATAAASSPSTASPRPRASGSRSTRSISEPCAMSAA